MPHLTLELSSNIEEKNILSLFKYCHSILSKMLPTEIHSCKSRSIVYDTYYIGDGKPNNAFVHLTVKIMPGRSPSTLKELSESIMNLLKNHFNESLKKLNLQITLEIIELQKTYFKITS